MTTKRYWTFTGRYAFYTKKGAEQFAAVIEEMLDDPDRVAGILSGSGYLVRQPLRPHGHVIKLAADGWTIMHPIDCDVLTCRLPKLAAKYPSVHHMTTRPYGNYRLFLTNGKFDIGNPMII